MVAKQGSQCQPWDTCCNLLPKEVPEVPQTIKVTITASGSMPELDGKTLVLKGPQPLVKLLSEGCCGRGVQCLDSESCVYHSTKVEKKNERARKTANNFL